MDSHLSPRLPHDTSAQVARSALTSAGFEHALVTLDDAPFGIVTAVDLALADPDDPVVASVRWVLVEVMPDRDELATLTTFEQAGWRWLLHGRGHLRSSGQPGPERAESSGSGSGPRTLP